jgi:hypothetical protein
MEPDVRVRATRLLLLSPFTLLWWLSLRSQLPKRSAGARASAWRGKANVTPLGSHVNLSPTVDDLHLITHPHSRPRTLHSSDKSLIMALKPITGVCAAIERSGH